MAGVMINKGMPRPEDPVLKLPRERWRLLAMARRQWAEIDLPFDCRLLRTVVDEAPLLAEELGLESGDQFLTEYLSLDLDLVGRVLGWLEQEQPTEAVPLAYADRSSQPEAAEAHAARAFSLTGTFAEAGDNRHTLSDPSLDIIKTTEQGGGGTSAAYLAARLKKAGRDDLLEQVGPEKPYRSIRAAAIEAGIIKPVPTVRLANNPVITAAAIVERMDREWCIAMMTAMAEQIRDAGRR